MLYLNKPVYTIPLETYEQKYNATVIQENHFGVSYKNLDKNILKDFLGNIGQYKKNIKEDKKILLNKKNGKEFIVDHIKKLLE